MADINVERKRPSIWPWVVGLIVLAFLIWAIAEMVDRDPVAGDPVDEPAAVPAPEPAPPFDEEPAELEDLAPLGPEDESRLVRVSGAVVGQPTAEGFWVLTDRDRVVFVRTRRPVVTGEHVDVTGTLASNPEEDADAWFDDARLRDAIGWNVERRAHIQVDEAPEVLPRQPDPRLPQQEPPESEPGQRAPSGAERLRI